MRNVCATMDQRRTPEFARDETYDQLLREMNSWFTSIEDQLTASLVAPRLLILFIVGLPRSGSTLLTQLLAASGGFAYPSNVLARFYANLYVGARIELLLRKVLPPVEFSYRSNFGRTAEWAAPNEFGFFWAHHFPVEDHHELSARELAQVDTNAFLRELAALEAAYGLPVFVKAMILNYNLLFLYDLLPMAIFVRTKRDYVSVARSLLLSRQKFFGTTKAWWSCKPRNWRELAQLDDPVEQVVAQIQSIERALDNAFAVIPGKNQATMDYDDLCKDPHGQVRRIERAMTALGCKPSIAYVFPRTFEVSRYTEDEHTLSRIRRYCEKYNLR
jgi:LPS sulfotransferase NodH